MAYHTIYFQNPHTGQIREAPVGFSWTTLFFGPLPMLFRGNWKLFLFVLLPAIITFTLSDIIFAFIINKLHMKDLLREGFIPKSGQLGTLRTILSASDPLLLSTLSDRPNKPSDTKDELCALLDRGVSVEELDRVFSGKSQGKIASIVSSPDACENYPLHVAIGKKRLDLAEWLLAAGADPDVENYWGKTAADIAIKNKDEEALALLRRHTPERATK